MITGFTSRFKLSRSSMKVEPVTRQTCNYGSEALETKSHLYTYLISTAVADADGTTSVINVIDAPSDVVQGDIVRLTSGTYTGLHFHILSVSGFSITLQTDMPKALDFNDTFNIERWVIPRLDSSGGSTFPATSAAVTPARGKIAATSLTSSYQTLLTMGGDVVSLDIFNSTDQAVLITWDGGTTDNLELDAGEFWSKDWPTIGKYLPSGTIQAKYVGATAPKFGSVRASVVLK